MRAKVKLFPTRTGDEARACLAFGEPVSSANKGARATEGSQGPMRCAPSFAKHRDHMSTLRAISNADTGAAMPPPEG